MELTSLNSQVHRRWPARLLLLFLVALFIFFLVTHATLHLATDDVAWLRGEPPTVFDRYRLLPRFFFVSLHTLFGPSPVAALTLISVVHALNGLLIYTLARHLSLARGTALVAAAVLLVNPITLATLTWISCFSYVLGTTLALLSLLACLRAMDAARARRLAWAAAALVTFAAGLLASHEIFFLPLLLAIVGWWRREVRLGALLFAAGSVLVLAVNALVYDFARYGVEHARLFTPDFFLAFASSGLSTGLALALAYPLSFLAGTIPFLQACLSEPLRWLLTLALLLPAILFARRTPAWRAAAALALAFVALIAPYLIRLYLTPASVNYHISYVLSGRVFYLAFVPIALGLALGATALFDKLAGWPYRPLLFLLPLAAYLHALFFYDRAAFLGLEVVEGASLNVPPRWNPFSVQHSLWLVVALLLSLVTFLLRLRFTQQRE
ncbi:MAG: hypothetical protein JXA93_05075 [Anaerolineae bacterium]|nr:hypothetical protein [Anaerolineae bacterium]